MNLTNNVSVVNLTRIKEVVNVPSYKLLLLLFIMAVLPHTYAVDLVTGSGYSSGTNEGYYVDYFSFYNYCPLCGHTDCLEVGVKRSDEITCSYCDSDWSFSGKEKHVPARAWLTSYVEPTPEPVINTTPVSEPVLSPLEIAKTVYISNEIL